MKKIFTLIATVLCTTAVCAQTESYVAVTSAGLSTEFANVINTDNTANNVVDGKSLVNISTANVDFQAVGGAVPATLSGAAQDINADGTVNSWASISWNSKNQGDINFYYILGTGNPYTAISAQEITTDGVGTGTYKAVYTYYNANGSLGMPKTGLYYKFTPKVAGTFKVGIWSNKGNRNTYVVDESTSLPITYSAEGYINGQNEGTPSVKKYLSATEVKAIHDAAKLDAVTGIDSAPYVIGAGNQPFWGYITFTAEAGKSYWLFQDSSQIGFLSFEFSTTTGISDIVTDTKDSSNAKMYTPFGTEVNSTYKGLVIQNGKKYFKK